MPMRYGHGGNTPQILDLGTRCRSVVSFTLQPHDRVVLNLISDHITYVGGHGSKGSIVSDYELDDRGSIPDRGKGFLF
jgi:hypothetical protein